MLQRDDKRVIAYVVPQQKLFVHYYRIIIEPETGMVITLLYKFDSLVENKLSYKKVSRTYGI